jgi:hypothetical protein
MSHSVCFLVDKLWWQSRSLPPCFQSFFLFYTRGLAGGLITRWGPRMRGATIHALANLFVVASLGSLSDSCWPPMYGILVCSSVAWEAALCFHQRGGHMSSASALLSKIPLYTCSVFIDYGLTCKKFVAGRLSMSSM